MDKDIINDYRPKYHISPPAGWLNDPNGLCQINGIYHVYFQYCPENADGNGEKCWGHYESSNMIDWKFTGVVLKPDKDWDKDGVYSGCSFIDDGKQYIFYTGNVKENGDYDYIYEGRQANTILVECENACSMGAKQLVMTNNDYPNDMSNHVRDPKVMKSDKVIDYDRQALTDNTDINTDRYIMVQGARTIEDKGVVLVFTSDDLKNWKYNNRITTANNFGYMWECPDLFRLKDMSVESGNKELCTVLSVSPQGIEKEERTDTRYQNIYQSGYYLINGNVFGASPEENKLGKFTEWDKGFDFYAPQTFEDENGRRILIGWAGIPDAEYTNEPSVMAGWQHMLTLPRQLSINNGKVYQFPVREYDFLLKHRIDYSNTLAHKNAATFSETEAYAVEINNIDNKEIRIFIAGDLELIYSKKDNIFEVKLNGHLGYGRKSRKAYIEKLEHIRYYIDSSIAEIFINNGEIVFTTRFYPDSNIISNTIM